ncbi:pyrroloquinoline quinone biosynthesis protein PqqE [Xanthomonas campestris]|uniref:pyrroloquinoline quinone biosynthesis protein PqqE n=1 Tax=Xanthomonas campestris TaxID=339 RepID=UPI00216A22CA|nr:pyrroloquinoline quinone biosynthesis protein PqqE [Xanthomonas campestris]MCS3848050.1 pyrroloquinoline quinone biosynthesis protein E [Xanthomonas campestris]MEA0759719.1 pyrroloquinoline quinone biosynthesis protein PqqE [Xanthomonas campestris pv. campestris]MEB1222009.1 pyrroloquinoline quinone biosynthesis protein PqqE [Xanthomonas campestris pv. campestris]MEB1242516.1 pyrroloquinoline quinone biosynthesis protein PqqE [Xanthomonas campestris pv. campestris]MEB1250690.1 pyrroloquinol
MSTVPPPLSVLLELTHRCPLACPYCSNPIALAALREEMDTAGWRSLLEQAAEMGVLQAHFSGGEPMLRKDLPELVAHARALGLYSNLITSGVAGGEPMLDQLQAAGLEHVQLSVQDVDPAGADHIAGYRNSLSKKRAFAAAVRARGLPLTLNAVIHRHNAERVPGMIALALEWGAERIEVAHTQYYGWGLRNRAALMPSREQLAATIVAVETARRSLGDQLAIDFVTPDYYARQPKPCMGGWAQRFVNISPRGDVLPCHAAETIDGLQFDNLRDRSLADIWNHGEAFARFRGTAWMPEVCQGCPKREIDWGGCRCQALALAGDAATLDPVCERSPAHAGIRATAEREAASPAPDFIYRRPERPAAVAAEAAIRDTE